MNSNPQNETQVELLSVEETAKFLKTTPKTLYIYLCDSGKNGGLKRNRIPSDIYIKLGRKTLFIKNKLIAWIQKGAPMAQKEGE